MMLKMCSGEWTTRRGIPSRGWTSVSFVPKREWMFVIPSHATLLTTEATTAMVGMISSRPSASWTMTLASTAFGVTTVRLLTRRVAVTCLRCCCCLATAGVAVTRATGAAIEEAMVRV